MATPTIQIRTRVDRNLKRQSDLLLASLGLDTGAYVTMALAQLVNRRGLPFAVTESDEAYFTHEYDLSPSEKSKAGIRMKKEAAKAKKAGQLKEITNLKDLEIE